MVFLDTHVVVWLGQGELRRISAKAQRLIDNNPIFISPFVRMELGILFEMGRFKKPPGEFLPALLENLDGQVYLESLPLAVAEAEKFSWTRDPFDRLIVGHCAAAGGDLITKDQTIRTHFRRARW